MSNDHKPYRPSNSTEGDIFMDRFCYRCAKHDERDGCPIINASMAFDIGEAGYPDQLRTDGLHGYCTDYIHENGRVAPGVDYLDQPDPTAAARAEAQAAAGQLGLFEPMEKQP